MKTNKLKESYYNDIKEKILSCLLLFFTLLFLFFPISYGLYDLKILIIFSGLIIFICPLIKKTMIKNNEKYYIWIILILASLTRIGIVILCEPYIEQVSDFKLALELSNDFSLFKENSSYYRMFTHWVLYPVIVSFIFKLFGATQFVALMTNAITLIINAILVYKIIVALFNTKRYGFWGAFLYIVWPANILYTLIFTQEHLGTLFLLIVLYLFINYEKEIVCLKNNHLRYLYFILLGFILGLSSFFKNFAPIFLIAFIIYYFMRCLKENNIKSFIYSKCFLILIMSLSFFVTKYFTFLYLDVKVGEPVVRNITPCYINVGLRGLGVYDENNYQMYLDALENVDFNYKEANKNIIDDLKKYLKSDSAGPRKFNFWDNKAKILFGRDSARISWVKSSIKNPNLHPTAINSLNYIEKYNNYFFVILVFAVMLGLIDMCKKKDLETFLLYLIFFGCFLMLILIEAQNRYMYSVQIIMCILAIPGTSLFVNSIYNKIIIEYFQNK